MTIDTWEDEGGTVIQLCADCFEEKVVFDSELCLKCYIKRYPPSANTVIE